MTHDKRKTTSTGNARIIEWAYSEGPPRRSWRWYAAILAIGLIPASLFAFTLRSDSGAVIGMIIWVTIVIAMSLVPRRQYAAQLDGQLLYLWDLKRNKVVIERNFAEFATYRVETIPEDRLNEAIEKVVFLRRDGGGAVEITLSWDEKMNRRILERVAEAVPAAPAIAPNLVARVDRFAQRWLGWR